MFFYMPAIPTPVSDVIISFYRVPAQDHHPVIFTKILRHGLANKTGAAGNDDLPMFHKYDSFSKI
jgi:hypothetical protein